MKAVQNTIPDRKYRWRYSKAQLTAAFPKEMKHGPKRSKENVRAFTAVTDGQLQCARSYGIKLILECKKDKREKCGLQVDMQEAAQIVAWVKEYPSTERQRVLISHNGPQIYVTFAKYDDAWVDYLEGKDVKGNDKSLLTMSRVGPFTIDNVDEMRAVVTILVALHL
ncbi:uncharacterized protein TRUGW13939_03066 [Talaromyces rugulosus]|uniref:Uncharacterized protein n=1 Tax=Talaromyces rugulosus TaxID=121627 RepID=A0A7H8QPT2_TALRU|nr:uncharacterized protein TRUGW13939_03066 [Talaromyces rugulosus]QKX55967.1 hypothetical protein TRUGW13939_03066 [Talaromyces rugulosus]